MPRRTGDEPATSVEIAVWREAGRLICQCGEPHPRYIDWANCCECATCGKLMLGRKGEELLRRRAEMLSARNAWGW